jgi:hypothetical protein
MNSLLLKDQSQFILYRFYCKLSAFLISNIDLVSKDALGKLFGSPEEENQEVLTLLSSFSKHSSKT